MSSRGVRSGCRVVADLGCALRPEMPTEVGGSGGPTGQARVGGPFANGRTCAAATGTYSQSGSPVSVVAAGTTTSAAVVDTGATGDVVAQSPGQVQHELSLFGCPVSGAGLPWTPCPSCASTVVAAPSCTAHACSVAGSATYTVNQSANSAASARDHQGRRITAVIYMRRTTAPESRPRADIDNRTRSVFRARARADRVLHFREAPLRTAVTAVDSPDRDQRVVTTARQIG
jgi:hypothetical protein